MAGQAVYSLSYTAIACLVSDLLESINKVDDTISVLHSMLEEVLEDVELFYPVVIRNTTSSRSAKPSIPSEILVSLALPVIQNNRFHYVLDHSAARVAFHARARGSNALR